MSGSRKVSSVGPSTQSTDDPTGLSQMLIDLNRSQFNQPVVSSAPATAPDSHQVNVDQWIDQLLRNNIISSTGSGPGVSPPTTTPATTSPTVADASVARNPFDSFPESSVTKPADSSFSSSNLAQADSICTSSANQPPDQWTCNRQYLFGDDMGMGRVESLDFFRLRHPLPEDDVLSYYKPPTKQMNLGKVEADSWHSPISSQLSSSTSSSSSSTAVSSMPNRPPSDDVTTCQIEFRRLVVRLLEDYATRFGHPFSDRTNKYICDDLLQLLFQFSDSLAQCYLTILHEYRLLPIESFEWLVKQPVENDLVYYAHEQVAAGRVIYSQNGGDWNQTTHIPRPLVERWLQRFQSTVPPNFSSHSQVDDTTRIDLANFVESGLECLLFQLHYTSRSSLNVLTLWRLLQKYNLYRQVWGVLGCRFDLNQVNQPPTWIPLAIYQHQQRPLEPFEVAFKIATSGVQTRMNEMNAASWYMQSEKLSAYATQFALGEMRSSPLSLELTALGVQPFQFFGRLPTNFLNGEVPSIMNEHHEFMSFLLTDSAGTEYRLLLGRDQLFPHHIVWNLDDAQPICQARFGFDPANRRFGAPGILIQSMPESPTFQSMQFNRTIFFDSLLTHDPMKRCESDNPFQLSSPTSPSQPSSPPPLPVLESMLPLDLNTRSQVYQSSMSFMKWNTHWNAHDSFSAFSMRPGQTTTGTAIDPPELQYKSEVFERIITSLQPLAYFSRFGPTLYEDNQPIKIKREFHSLFMDACLIADGLEPLPKVLNELISDYYTIPIPFIPEEADSQMSVYPLDTSSHYPGVRTNPIESSHILSNSLVYHFNSQSGEIDSMNHQPQPMHIYTPIFPNHLTTPNAFGSVMPHT